jgi:hypothetical protein
MKAYGFTAENLADKVASEVDPESHIERSSN